MQDPPRRRCEAVRRSCSAGIKIVVIIRSAGVDCREIARKNWHHPSPDAKVISGVELAEMDDTVLKEVLKGEAVFARMAPETKYRIVCALGDGQHCRSNRRRRERLSRSEKADIGIAMELPERMSPRKLPI